ncbi:MAG: HAMP domain-containing histidine kinase [Saprospiraceae bacterium]|nr:HAMP domain-containing histidine kinase [Saprospiraceae bacterium]
MFKTLFGFSRHPLTHKELFDNVLVISILSTAIFTINAFLIIQNLILGTLNTLSTLVFIFCLYLSKITTNYRLSYRIYSVYLLIILNGVWFLGGGYNGFNGYVMMLLLAVMMVIREKTNQLWILAVLIVNVIVLFGIELRYPELPNIYPEPINLISQGVVLIMSLITLYYFLYTLKKNYQLQKMIADSSNMELESRNQFIREQNKVLTNQSKQLEVQKGKLEKQSSKLSKMVEERTVELSKANEDLLNKNIKLDQFTGILAHNIRGPVARIKGLADLLKHSTVNAEVDETMMRVRESIYDLDQVLRDLQTILDIQRGHKSGFEQITIVNELNKALSILNDDIVERNVSIKKSIEPGLEIKGYKAYFQSIFYNLLSNAIKFSSEERQPVIEIRGHTDNGQIILEVEDNGLGIEMKYAGDKIFKLYQRFNYNHPGKGVGLYLVKAQVEAMHGDISLKSKLQEGTTFTMTYDCNSNNLQDN